MPPLLPERTTTTIESLRAPYAKKKTKDRTTGWDQKPTPTNNSNTLPTPKSTATHLTPKAIAHTQHIQKQVQQKQQQQQQQTGKQQQTSKQQQQLQQQQHKEQNLQKKHKQKLILALEQVLEDAGARWGSYVEIGDVDFDKLITAKALAPRLDKNERDSYMNIFRLTPTGDEEYVFTPPLLSPNDPEAANDDIELLSD